MIQFDLSTVEHVLTETGNPVDRRVPGKQLTKADVPELRFKIGGILREAEENRWSVILRPRPVTAVLVVQLDDLGGETVEQLEPYAFLIVRTSPGNFQVWIALNVEFISTDFAARLRRGVGADHRANNAGRLAGSRNHKPKYAPAFPVVEIEHLCCGHVVSGSDLERIGLVAPPLRSQPKPVSATTPVRRGYPGYDYVLRGAPRKKDGSPDRSRADAFWCKWAAERGYSVGEIAAELSRVSERARERIAMGETNYAIQKAEWGVQKAGVRFTVNGVDCDFLSPPLPVISAASISSAAAAGRIDTPELPPDLAALVDPELGITADIFVAPDSPTDLSKADLPLPEVSANESADISAHLPPESAGAIAEFQKFFIITGVRVAGPKDRGIPYAEWKARELNGIFAQHRIRFWRTRPHYEPYGPARPRET